MLGRFLFRWRGTIGALAFGVVFWLARPTVGSCLLGVPLLVLGLAVRFWASGYIGIDGRVRDIGARQRIVSGPYRLLRHPLYVGNMLLVLGMLVAMRPALWLSVIVVVGFVAEYALIISVEERQLASVEFSRSQNSEGRSQKAEVQTDRPSPESMVHGRESFVAGRALVEWRTWLVTGAAWGLSLLKAFITR
jgi:hypothetical protein